MTSLVTVTLAATSRRFVTPEMVRERNGIAETVTGAIVDAVLDEVSGNIENACNRADEMFREAVSEQIRLDCAEKSLRLERWPVATLTSITEDGVALTASDYEIDMKEGEIWRLRSDYRTLWTASKIVVVYAAGYIAADLTNANVPAALRDAALAAFKSTWLNRTRDPLVKAEQVEGVGRTDYWVGSIGESDALPPEALDKLGPYTRQAVG